MREWIAFAVIALMVVAVFVTGVLDRQRIWSNLPYYYMSFEDGQTVFDVSDGDEYGIHNRGPNFDLPKGVYQLKIRSFADGDNVIHVVSENKAKIEPEQIQLKANEMDCIVDLNVMDDSDNVEFLVDFQSGTRLEFVDIRIYSPMYRDHAFTFAFVAAAACVLYAMWVKGRLSSGRRGRLILMATAVMMMSVPSFKDNLLYLLDTNYHLARLLNLADGLKNGFFPVRLGGYTYNGYGAITSVFYPDFFLYPFAGMILGGASLQYTMNIYHIVLNAMSAVAMYVTAKRIFKDEWIGTCASVLYVCSIYRVTDIYVRGALGEATAMALLPFFVLGLWEVFFGDKGRYSILMLSAAGIFLSHMLSTLMCACLAAGMFVLFLPKLIKEGRMLSVIKAAVGAVLLCAFQIVPFLGYSMDGIGAQSLRVSMESRAISPAQLFLIGAGDMPVDPKDYSLSGMPLEIGLPLILGVALALYVCQRKWEKNETGVKEVLLFTGAGALFAFMCTNLFPWGIVSMLTKGMADYIQFPWRFLMFVSVLFSLAGAYGYIRLLGSGNELGVIIALVVSLFAVMPTIGEQTRCNDYIEYGEGATPNLSYLEYTIPGTQTAPTNDRSILIDGDVTVTEYRKESVKVEAQVEALSDAKLSLPLFGYDGYRAQVDGKDMEITLGENNRLTVWLPAGTQGELRVWFEGKTIWRVAEAVSLATAACLIGMQMVGKKRRKKQ